MLRRPPNLPHDQDFQSHRPQPPAPPLHLVKYYQRLVVNPFLSTIPIVGALLCLRYLSQGQHSLPVWSYPVSSGIILIAAYFLLQTHCIDCGETQIFHLRSHHACASVRKRWMDRAMVPTIYPTPNHQLMLWLLSLPILAFLMIAVIRHEL